jgi:hypothetical protein
LDNWKSKNSYKIMKWADDPNLDYSDHRCSRDNSVAVQLLPMLANRGYCPVLAFDGGNWGLSLSGCQSIGPMPLSVQAEFDDSGDMWKPTISEAICHTVLSVIDHEAETT